jgi:O-succinylbenzoic acid--CoA ligase
VLIDCSHPEKILAMDPTDPSLSVFEQNVILFLQQWLRGKTDFTITSSGSTGRPQPFTFTRSQAEASAALTIQALSLDKNHTALVCLDTKYMAGQMMLVRALVAGMKIFVIDPSSRPLQKVPRHQKIDFAAFVPLQIQTMLHEEGEDCLFKISKIIIGGAPLEQSLVNRLHNHPGDVYLTYGMTETLSHVALQKINGADASDSFVVLPGVTIHHDERGCAVIHTPFTKNEIVTNDVIEFTSATTFRFIGRADFVINSGGVKINPEKIELQIAGCVLEALGSRRFMVSGIPDPALGQKVVLFIEGVPVNTVVLLQKIKETVSRFEVPKEITFIDVFEQTATQKVNRIATLQKFLS